MNILKFGFLVITGIVAISGSAKADYAIWSDAKTGVTLSFPDSWKLMNNQLPIDVITLSVPSGDDRAECRVQSEEDKRFMIYPSKNRPDIRDLNFTREYWEKYVTAYNNVNVIRYADNTGLGQGFSSMVLLSYLTTPDTKDGSDVQDRGGVMAVTNYGDKVYVVQCSSLLPSYSNYHSQFMSFFKSISFKKAYHESVVGDYRNFLNEMGTIDVPFPNAVSRSTY